MGLIKKIFLSSLIMASAITLSSCSILDMLKSQASQAIDDAEKSKEAESKNDSTNPSTSVEPSITQPGESSSSSSTTEIVPIIIDELDYGYLDIEKNGSTLEKIVAMQSYYKDVKRVLDEFSKSDRNLTSQSVTITERDQYGHEIGSKVEDYYFIGDVFYTDYGINASEALMVVKEVFLDYPEYYFVDNRALTFSSSKTTGTNTEYTYSIRLVCDEDYKDANKRLEYNQSIESYKAIVSSLFEEDSTDLDKVRIVHDYIINHAKYAYEADGVTPKSTSYAHNMLGIVLNGEGVCESYTELFTYLLKSFNIPAITVSGKGYTNKNKSGEPHAWNYVYLNNQYYMFDVTWNDSTGTNYYYGLSESNSYNMSKVAGNIVFNNPDLGGHEPTDRNISDGLNYLYSLPDLSSTNLLSA